FALGLPFQVLAVCLFVGLDVHELPLRIADSIELRSSRAAMRRAFDHVYFSFFWRGRATMCQHTQPKGRLRRSSETHYGVSRKLPSWLRRPRAIAASSRRSV